MGGTDPTAGSTGVKVGPDPTAGSTGVKVGPDPTAGPTGVKVGPDPSAGPTGVKAGPTRVEGGINAEGIAVGMNVLGCAVLLDDITVFVEVDFSISLFGSEMFINSLSMIGSTCTRALFPLQRTTFTSVRQTISFQVVQLI